MELLIVVSLALCLLLAESSPARGSPTDFKVRGVNLGGWLVIEGWIKPSLFDGIPNGDMLDGTQVQFMSLTSYRFISAQDGLITVDKASPSQWETFKLWRISSSEFRLRTFSGQFISCDAGACGVSPPSSNGIFIIERSSNNRIHLRLSTGLYLQAETTNQLTPNYPGTPDWGENSGTFQMIVVSNAVHGDYQLANGYGYVLAKEVLRNHRNTFITVDDFKFLARHGINTVRIPVGWWIAFDREPPSPFVGGSLEALDNAFSWAQSNSIKCIIDLHAAPGSQNGMEHSASRDGTVEWANSPEYVSVSLRVIDFLAARYASHPALLGIELLNEPSGTSVPLEVLVQYYREGYEIVRKHSASAYVVVCQRIGGNVDPLELYEANIGSYNLVLDIHFYDMFDGYFDNISGVGNIDYVYNNREKQLRGLIRGNGPLVFVGEWVNEWNVSGASKEEYQRFGNAQLDVYSSATFGWAYWTLKCEKKHWDFVWNVKYGYLQIGNCCKRKVSAFLLLAAVICFL